MFEPNEDAEVKVIENIKGRSAIIVDDFYRDPDEVRELALSLEYSVDSGLVAGFPGMRGSLKTSEVKEKLYNLYLDLCNNKLWKNKEQQTYYKERPFNLNDFNSNWNEYSFLVNQTNDLLAKKSPLAEIPHQDYWEDESNELADFKDQHLQFGSVIYLNTPDECAGGTNLYSYKGEMCISSERDAEWMKNMAELGDLGPVLTSMSDDYKFKYIKDKVNNQYTVEFEAEMKYNRMVLYQADVLHKGNIDLGMFTDYNRINQVFFM